MNMLMENIAVAIIPVLIVALILVSLVMLFAREKALFVLRQLYLYGVTITAFLVSAVAIILLLYTLLTTTLLPTQGSDDYYRPQRAWDIENVYSEYKFEVGAKEYLQAEQEKIDRKADAIETQQEWRDQLAWAIPLILVFAPIFFLYRRHFNFISKEDEKVEYNLAKTGYLFLATFLGLMALALGSAGLINVGLESIVLPPSQQSYMIRDAIDQVLRTDFPYPRSENAVITLSRTQAENVVNKANQQLMKTAIISIPTRNRSLSLSLVFILVGGGVYWWHRRELFVLLK